MKFRHDNCIGQVSEGGEEMATSSFQKNFSVTRRHQDLVADVMTSDTLGAKMSKKFSSKFSKTKAYQEQLSAIFTVKEVK